MTDTWQVGARTVCVKSVAKTQGQHVAIPAAVLVSEGPHEERQTEADDLSLVSIERGWNACRRSGGACLFVCVGACVCVLFAGPVRTRVHACVCVCVFVRE